MTSRPMLAAAALGALLLGGCGIPSETDVVAVGPGPVAAADSVGSDGAEPPPGPAAADTLSDFVHNYFDAAAASNPDESVNQIKPYLDVSIRSTFKAPADGSVKVIHIMSEEISPSNSVAKLSYRQVGSLGKDGALTPAPDPDTVAQMEITIRDKDGSWAVMDAMAGGPTMTDDALASYYTRHTIYFWNNDNTGLVPDERYIAKTVHAVQWPTVIVGWLTSGPAKWLAGSVQTVPGGPPSDNVPPIDNFKLTITLNATAADPSNGDDAQQRMERLSQQLRWSLSPLPYNVLYLKIAHEDAVPYSGDSYLWVNPAYRPPFDGRASGFQRFVLYKNKIVRYTDSSARDDSPPVLKPEANANLAAATLRKGGEFIYAAVVTAGKSPVLKVAAGARGATADLTPVSGLTGTLGRPVWASVSATDPNSAVGLIVAGGKLYAFSADGKTPAKPIDWQPNQPITAVSVAPDGRRVAVIAGGKLYRAVLDTSDMSLSPGEWIQPGDLRTVNAVSWDAENLLTVAGINLKNISTLIDAEIDGALTTPTTPDTDLGTTTVTYLATVPLVPDGTEQGPPVPGSYMIADTAYDIGDLSHPLSTTDMMPSDKNPPANTRPVFPFFLY